MANIGSANNEHPGRHAHGCRPQRDNTLRVTVALMREAILLLEELRGKKAEIEALVTRYGARHIRVFGSVARGEERPDSDVDFLVELPLGYDLFGQRMPLSEKLAELLKRKVELIPEHELSRHIRDQVLNEAVEL